MNLQYLIAIASIAAILPLVVASNNLRGPEGGRALAQRPEDWGDWNAAKKREWQRDERRFREHPSRSQWEEDRERWRKHMQAINRDNSSADPYHRNKGRDRDWALKREEYRDFMCDEYGEGCDYHALELDTDYPWAGDHDDYDYDWLHDEDYGDGNYKKRYRRGRRRRRRNRPRREDRRRRRDRRERLARRRRRRENLFN